VRVPPAIVKGPEMHHIFRDSATVEMICVATASDNIEYVSKFSVLTRILRLTATKPCICPYTTPTFSVDDVSFPLNVSFTRNMPENT